VNTCEMCQIWSNPEFHSNFRLRGITIKYYFTTKVLKRTSIPMLYERLKEIQHYSMGLTGSSQEN